MQRKVPIPIISKELIEYLNSIFQINWTTTSSYSQIDKDIIRLLYHPNMKVGLNENEVDVLLRSILINEK